ncbi:MAG: DinB family protein [Chloroflexi bacterium]|nr:DinB family protein [Chloroflexota bacterium]
MSNGEAARFWSYIEGATDRIVGALDGLEPDELNWRPAGPETNSLFVLATHTLGALDETLLGVLCGEPRSRDRDAEFVASDSTAEAPVARWADLRRAIGERLAALPDEALDEARQHPRRGATTGRDLLIFTAQHAAEHAAHTELTRQLIEARRGS